MFDVFYKNYAETRVNFLSSAKKSNFNSMEYKLSNLKGVHDEDLCTDFAIKKGTNNKKAMVIISGTHGVEGFCGSALQQKLIINEAFVSQLSTLSMDLILIHALNPYGFSYLRRVNENNVDINRNFINFSHPLPLNEGYKNLHPLLLPDEWMGKDHECKQKQFNKLLEQSGLKELQKIISFGQYNIPNGIFFGGTCAEWSNITLNKIVKEHLNIYEDILFIDIHTGLGEFGQIEIIHDMPKNKRGVTIAKEWFEDRLKIMNNDASSTAINGSTANSLTIKNFRNLITLTIEFGTIPILKVFEAICADNWLHANNLSPSSNFYSPIKKMIKDAFYCDNINWKNLVTKNAKIFFEESIKKFEKL